MRKFASRLRGTAPKPCLSSGLLTALGVVLAASPASAVTTLTVDLATVLRPVTHVGNGSLFGVIEAKPADLNALVAPLHPNMFTNPAAAGAGRQQPVGDAITVAQRVAPFGATVTIRFADWFPGWYSFTNMTDWLGKIDQTIARKKAANLTNVYAYELWNEPNGTWAGSDPDASGSKPLSFNQMWLQTYRHVRQADPGVKITGPSLAGYNAGFMQGFLSFCKTNDCLPDIIGWHEGTGISNNVSSYRALEKQLGVGPLPISMNEYSGYGQIKDEGRPGASAPLIAQLERSGVETACITYWDVPHPGRLGSLLANDTERNGGWWFYKWYGEMSGSMVTTKSSLAVNGTNLDGVASIDAEAKTASVILGGINDGSVQVVVKGFGAAPFFAGRVHTVVERTPWASMATVVNATTAVSSADLAISNDQLSVTIANTNGDDGFHLALSAIGAGGANTGGASGAGGITSTGGAASAMGGAVSNTGGAASSTGGAASGKGGTTATGGASPARGGASAMGGTPGAAGAASTTGGAAASTGGTLAAGGTTAAGGARASGGALTSGGSTGGANVVSGAGGAAATASDSAGCGCRVARGSSDLRQLTVLGMLGMLVLRRRRSYRAAQRMPIATAMRPR